MPIKKIVIKGKKRSTGPTRKEYQKKMEKLKKEPIKPAYWKA